MERDAGRGPSTLERPVRDHPQQSFARPQLCSARPRDSSFLGPHSMGKHAPPERRRHPLGRATSSATLADHDPPGFLDAPKPAPEEKGLTSRAGWGNEAQQHSPTPELTER